MSGWLASSIERRLPLLMMVLLALILSLSLGVTHAVLIRQAEDAAYLQLAGASREIAASAGSSITDRLQALERFVALPEVQRVVLERTAPDSATIETLAEGAEDILAPIGDPSVIELWGPDGRAFGGFGQAQPNALRPAPVPTEPVAMTDLWVSGDGVYSWSIAPVVSGSDVRGFVAWQLKIGSPPSIEQLFSELAGQPLFINLRSADGTVWARHPAIVAPKPPVLGTRRNRAIYDFPQGRALMAEAPVEGTPMVVAIATPLRAIDARARATTGALALASLLLLALGTVGAWAITRRMIHPLTSVSTAAVELAAGNYGRRVEEVGDDELARLARSFNQMAAEIEASRRELIQRIDQANEAREEADEARTQAERASRAKSDFLAVMSHELRTPLNAIAGYVDLLRLGVHGPITQPQEDALARIARNQDHLLRLIHDVLSYVRLDADKVEYVVTDVPVANILAELESFVTPQILAAELRFEREHPPAELAVRADADKLRQILLNLATNAIKFTRPDGTVAVRCQADAERVRILVEDSGVGIAPDRLDAIFDPFFQAERALNRPVEGVGLGLTISRDLARGMGGDITVESELGRGSVFTLELPRGTAPPPTAPASAAGAEPAGARSAQQI